MNRIQVKPLLMSILLTYTGSLLADDKYAQLEESPSMELLEFLGNWETTESQWLDPMLLTDDDIGIAKSETATEVKDEK